MTLKVVTYIQLICFKFSAYDLILLIYVPLIFTLDTMRVSKYYIMKPPSMLYLIKLRSISKKFNQFTNHAEFLDSICSFLFRKRRNSKFRTKYIYQIIYLRTVCKQTQLSQKNKVIK